jgi:ligand-binding SRPBCC domain-containing protein
MIMAFYQIREEQIVPAGIDRVWDFISNPGNLAKITPDYMGFRITSQNLPDRIYPGMIITYIVRPLFGIPMKWVTEITHIEEKHYFVDEQRIGPYALWHHEHILKNHQQGVLMTDIVSYKPPLGFLGRLANIILIRKQLKVIFEYRKAAIDKEFPVAD